jgi:hypothetical protein
MRFRDIDKMQTLSRLEFAAYMRQPTAPLILTGAMRDWPAMEEWSLEFFGTAFSRYPIVARAPQSSTVAVCSVKTTVGHYVDYLCNPANRHIQGQWIKGDPDILANCGWTLYAGGFNPAHPILGNRELLFKYVPSLPDFIDCWRSRLDPNFCNECELARSHYFVYLSAPGGVTPLHHDFWSTHAFLAQIVGRKEAFLFSPASIPLLYSELTRNVRKMMDDPKFADVEGWRAILSPGDMLILPSRWPHYVETLETSITYSADWIDSSNWRTYVTHGLRAIANRKGRTV